MEGKIENIYPLSPMQQGMLFHSLLAPEAAPYFEQVSYRLEGDLDPKLMRFAWQRVVDRHEALRTGFVWKDLDEPLQVVLGEARQPVVVVDWRALSEPLQRERLDAFLRADRRAGFDLHIPPLMRIALLRVGDQVWEVVWSHHHLLLDGWSAGFVMEEVSTIYSSLRDGREPLLSSPRPYSDYIGWLQKQSLATAETFWRRTLRGVRSPTPFGIDRPGVGAGEFAERRLGLSLGATAELQRLARRQAMTLNTLIQGAWALLLGRYGGKEDVVFGFTVSGRPEALRGAESIVGLLINTLPVRVRATGSAHLRLWLQRLQAEQVELREYEYTPLVRIQSWSEIPGGTPLFESLVVFESFAASAEGAGSGDGYGRLRIKGMRAFERTGYPLTVTVAPGERVWIRFTYDAERFDGASMGRLAGHFEALLAGIARDPECRLEDLRLLTAAERHQIATEWNDTREGGSSSGCVHDLFALQASGTPDATALEHAGGEISYRELDTRVSRLARRLRRLGVAPEIRVGLCTDRSPDMVVGLLAILRAGGAYVPLDPAYPKDRLSYMLEDADVRVLVTQTPLLGALGRLECPTICLDVEAGVDEPEPLPELTDPETLAYVLYTSGSTGRPKGVQITHRNLVNFLLSMHRRPGLEPADRLLAVTSLSFDIAGLEIYLPLIVGARAILLDRSETIDGESFRRRLEGSGANVLQTTPSAWRLLLESGWRGDPGLKILCGGEALSSALAVDLVRRGGTLWNLYGPTETTIWSAAHRVAKSAEGAVPVGRPIHNTRILLLDAFGEPAPVGVAGELYIGGDGVARGYLERPGLTAERFVPQPYAGGAGIRMYRTGDLARYLPDGTVDFLGREDQQVKVRGFRIELGEIEAELEGHPAVRRAVVLAQEMGSGDQRLVGYLVPAESMPSTPFLRDFLREKLPEHMVPAAFFAVAEMPLTPNGKVDRRALLATESNPLDRVAAFVAPGSLVEKGVAEIWAQVLGVERVGLRENFFDLGGHSLLASQVMSRVAKVFDLDLPLRTLFEAPTVDDLARRVDAALAGGSRFRGLPLLPVPRDGDLPLSFAQQRLWFLDQLQPGSTAYNIPLAVRLRGPLDADVLARSFSEIARRHETLRTAFPTEEGSPRLEIQPPGSLALPEVDLRGLPETLRTVAARRLAGAEAARPFDLARAPLIRVCLLRLDEEGHVLAGALHHIVGDGGSLAILTRELFAIYGAFDLGRPSPLPELPVQYVDFAFWQRQGLQGVELQAEIDFWRRQLAGAPAALELATDRPRPAVQSFRGASTSLRLSADLAAELRRLSREEGTTLFMTLLAAYQLLLARLAEQTDVVVGTPVDGRTYPEVEDLIGLFVNTLVLRGDLSGNPTFRELLPRVREAVLEAHAHQGLPFEKLVAELHPQRSLSRSPIFQAMLVVDHAQAAPGGGLSGLRASAFGIEERSAKFDLTLFLVENGVDLEGALEFNPDLFDRSTAMRLCDHFLRLLAAVVLDVEQGIHDLALFGEAERHQLLREWNDTRETFPEALCVHDLIAAQAARSPEALAVVCGGETLSFGELDRRSADLAYALGCHGVGPESLVGLLLSRSLEMVIAVLGVLKAGGAYVPLDPEVPSQRLAYILEDCRPHALIVEEKLRSLLPEAASGLPWLVPGTASPATPREVASRPGASPENLAYVIYTSGSTGRPKGVAIPHRGVVNYLSWCAGAYDVQAGEGSLVHSSLAFDLTVTSLLAPLAVGRPVELLPEGLGVDSLAEALRARAHLSLLKLTPAHLEMLGYQLRPAEASGASRVLVVGGESLSSRAVAHWRRIASDTRIFNEYGPTETVVGCSVFRVDETPRSEAVPIGTPIANTRLYVLDARWQPVPLGAAGELYVSGTGVARGYLNRPEMTAERFLPDPFGPAPGARTYRTGDQVRFLADGVLEFLGRRDGQVKVRGFRIETGEVEAVLARHPGVGQVVVVRSADGEAPRLLAYVVPRPESVLAVADLLDLARRELPAYMVPAVFIELDALPLTANGKVDRRSLPAPQAGRPGDGRDCTPPSNAAEATLARIWEEVLRLDRLGIHENFFEVGGDSILAVQVVARAHREGLLLSTAQLFRHQTVAALAIVATEPEAAPPAAWSLRPGPDFPLADLTRADVARLLGTDRGIEDVIPVSPIQQAMLAYTLSNPRSEVGFEQVSCLVRGDLDSRAFHRAWRRVVSRHAALRTAFVWQGVETPLQVVHAEVDLSVEEEDWRGADGHARLEDRLVLDRRRGFDLGRPPLMRLGLLRLEDRLHAVVWSSHHLLMDGWCRSLVLNEVLSCYEAFHDGVEPAFEEARPYRDYIAWLARRDPAAAEAFWRATLEGFTAPTRLGLPLPLSRTEEEREVFARHGLQLSAAATAEMQRVARRCRLTLNTFVKGAWSLLLSRYSGQDDIVFGAIFSGRPTDLPGVESIVGLFMNILPVRVRLPFSMPAAAWLEDLQREQAEYHLHEQTPLDRVQEWSAVPRGLHLFDHLFVFENYPLEGSVWKGAGTLRIEEVETAAKTNYALTLMAAPGRELAAVLIHDVRRLDSAVVERMARHLRVLLAGLVETPDDALGNLPMLSEEERGQALATEGGQLLDPHLRPVPPEVVGELYSVTAPRFGDREILTATGSAARLRADGVLERLGRSDDRVDVPGFGFADLWAITAELRRAPGVGDAVVLPWREGETLCLVAFAIPVAGEEAPPPELLRSHLRGRLPRPLVPAVVVSSADLPRLGGDRELDREALLARLDEWVALERPWTVPRNLLEAKLVRIWEEVLDRRPLSVTESFFELGGNSLLGMRLMARVREELGRDLPPSIFFQGETIEDLALALRDETDYFASPLVAIQPRGSAPPFFCVHPIGGSIMRYLALAPHLGDDRPLHGLEARNREEAWPSLEAMATHYLEEMLTIDAEGPYLVGGWSFGGLVAFEIAKQLERRGLDVALLALFDTTAPLPGVRSSEAGPDPDNLRDLVRLLDPSGRRLVVRFDDLERLDPREQKELILREAKLLHMVPAELQMEEALRDLTGFQRRVELARNYLPRGVVRGRIVLFRCAEQDTTEVLPEVAALIAGDPAMGWGRFAARPVEVVEVPGNHVELFSPPYVDVLGGKLRAALDDLAMEPEAVGAASSEDRARG